MTTFTDTHTDALSSLIAGIPRDQALGLRLIGLARAAAACHMAESFPPHPGARFTPGAQVGMEGPGEAQVLRSQAAGLARAVSDAVSAGRAA